MIQNNELEPKMINLEKVMIYYSARAFSVLYSTLCKPVSFFNQISQMVVIFYFALILSAFEGNVTVIRAN